MAKFLAFLFSLAAKLFGHVVPAPVPPPASQLPPVAPLPPGLIVGVTVDDISNLAAIVATLRSLPHKAYVRLVFDPGQRPSDYREAVDAIGAVAIIVGQPVDSQGAKALSVAAFRARFMEYVYAFPEIGIWEGSNETNGDWGGPNTAAQADASFDVIKGAGRLYMLTPYWNSPACEDANGDWLAWTAKNISAKVKHGADFVCVSIYGKDCAGVEPAQADVQKFIDALGVMFPNAKLGIGEFGNPGRADVLAYYLRMKITHPRWIFFGGYWYFIQDMVPPTKPLFQVLANAMK